MTGSKFVEAEGFARYWQDKESKGILVPEAVLKAVQAEAKAKAQDMTAQAATKESAPQPKHGGPPLAKNPRSYRLGHFRRSGVRTKTAPGRSSPCPGARQIL